MKAIRQFNELFIHHRPGNDGIIMVDDEGTIIFANSKTLGLLSYSSEELLGRRLADVLTPESRPQIEALLSSAGADGHGRRCEMVFRDRSDARIPAVVTGTDLYRRGQEAGRLLVVVDLRNRQELAEDLKDVQVRLRQSSLELTKRFWELSVIKEVAHTLQTTMNLDEMLRIILTGVTAEQGLGFNRAFLLLNDEVAGKIKGALAVGPASKAEAERIWLDLKNRSHSLRDLLERQRDASGQFDPALNEIVQQMEFDLSPDGGLVARAVLEAQSYNLTVANEGSQIDPYLQGLLGSEAFAVVPLIARGKPMGAVIADNRFTGRPIEEADVELLETLASHVSFAIERARLHERLVEKIRELERAYQELRQTQDQLLRAERLSAVGKMATRLSHELRSPITSIGGFARLVAKNVTLEDPNREYLNVIVEEVTRLERMMTEVLDFVRPREPSLERVDLRGLIQKVMATMQPDIDKGQIAASQELAPDLPEAEVDPLQISQVLINLIRNSLEAMSPGGKLCVRAKQVGQDVRLEVQDTGVGIPQEHQDRLFSEFFTTKSAGFGLGLTIAYQTVHHHGGSIGVRSREGQGATFFVHLPMNRGTCGDMTSTGNSV
jgi:PAS domain S-box-containing protein